MSDRPVTITGMILQGDKRVTNGGNTVLASFNFAAEDIGMKGCTLFRKTSGEHGFWPPTLDEEGTVAGRRSARRAVYFREPNKLFDNVLKASLALYSLMDSAPQEA